MAEPDLHIGGEGGGSSHPDPEKTGGPVSKKIFSALRASVWCKSKGRPGAGSPDPSPGSATNLEFRTPRCGFRFSGTGFLNFFLVKLGFLGRGEALKPGTPRAPLCSLACQIHRPKACHVSYSKVYSLCQSPVIMGISKEVFKPGVQ